MDGRRGEERRLHLHRSCTRGPLQRSDWLLARGQERWKPPPQTGKEGSPPAEGGWSGGLPKSSAPSEARAAEHGNFPKHRPAHLLVMARWGGERCCVIVGH